MAAPEMIVWLDKVGMESVADVGGKNASLGEMICHLTQAGVKVPHGFATTAHAYWQFLQENNLNEVITHKLATLNVENITELAAAGSAIRAAIMNATLSPAFTTALTEAYQKLSLHPIAVAVRSSATAEDLPNASFAGQQETYLNVTGIDNILLCVKRVFASLFNDRAIAYRVHQGFEHDKVALSVGVQQMVQSDMGASGVIFTLDTESGFDKVIFITSAYGLGETVVQGAVNPDEFYLYKPHLTHNRPAIIRKNLGTKHIKMVLSHDPGAKHFVQTVDVPEADRLRFSLTDAEIHQLGQFALKIEEHYKRPMDIEWAKDGHTHELFIVQARPETVKSRAENKLIERYELAQKGTVLVEGRAIGQRIGHGNIRIISQISEMHKIQAGDILVTDMTDPDWEPIMKRAAAIVTNRGGRTCHAAIIARELGIPAVVGCNNATQKLLDGNYATVSCAEGDTGYIYDGKLDFVIKNINLSDMPPLPFQIMMNIGNPDRAFDFQRLPNAGVGLARLEFVINRMIGIHPKALLEFDKLPDTLKKTIMERTACYDSPVDFYIKKLAEGIATLAAAFYPKRVIVRLSDFKSNEYANLLGGDQYEPKEENPMIGFRGASRYVAESFKDCFELECRAIRYVRNEMGFTNVEVMVPFVRTIKEAEAVIQQMADFGLKRGEHDLKIIMMCEVPSNALLAGGFLQHFDGFSIGSNDMTQLALGLDRDSGIVAHLFDERDAAIKTLLHMAIQACKKTGKYVGICGQGPSDHPDFAYWLMQEGINSISLNPDSVLETWLYLASG